jgi:glycyl-tRNA synthetase alpha chain
MFNLLDARGAISVTERVGVMARIRALVLGVAKAYVAQGEALKCREQGTGSREQAAG